ncbi:MAG: hypothetical protein NTW29_13450 [Bacteroidetes bacterium]|nr:hypothetical protein [Bacteroidota bacterium]
MSNKSSKLIFSPRALPYILDAFGKTISENGIIIDSETSEPVLTPEGDELHKDNFGGIKKGSVIFMKQGLLSAIKLTEGKYDPAK